MPTHECLGPDDCENLQDKRKPAIQLDKEPAIIVREPDATRQPTPHDIQLMSKHRVLSFKPQLRLEWRGQDGQNETEQPDHSASLGDSITASTRITFSVHTGGRTVLRTHGGKLKLARRVSPLSRSSSVVLRQFRTIGYSGELWRSVAEREGFEPPIGLHLCRISSAVHSTTLPPLQAPRRVIPQPAVGACSRRGWRARQGAGARFPKAQEARKRRPKWSI